MHTDYPRHANKIYEVWAYIETQSMHTHKRSHEYMHKPTHNTGHLRHHNTSQPLVKPQKTTISTTEATQTAENVPPAQSTQTAGNTETAGNTQAASDSDIHVVFTSGCDLYQSWQAEMLLNSHMFVGQPGQITRVVTGCDSSGHSAKNRMHYGGLALQKTDEAMLRKTSNPKARVHMVPAVEGACVRLYACFLVVVVVVVCVYRFYA
jgi:hypothetical protein